MGRDTRVQLVALVVLLVSLAVCGALTPLITTSIGRNKLSFTDRAEEGQPPEIAMGIAMGAFRGVFVNYLWIRANTLKEAGKYHEAIQLSEAITKLQPRFPRVWVFHAWNMAYNISVTTQTPSERWGWVNAGIKLLREKGIPANPNDLLLHKELAWIFIHKVQGYTDDANPYYKRQFAAEWTILLGEPPRPDSTFRDRVAASDRYIEWLRPIADAPPMDEVTKADPLANELVDALRAQVVDEFDFEFLRKYQIQAAIQKSLRRKAIESVQQKENPKRYALAVLMGDAKYAAAWPKVIASVRRDVLVRVYNMEPDRMIRFTDKYGPLDWRHAASHCIYWSARGVEQSLNRWTSENRKDYDFINTDRLTIQAVQDLARSGELYFSFFDFASGKNPLYLAIPNPNFIETYGEILGELVKRSWADSEKRAYSFYSAGYENFLRDQIRFYWRRNQKDMANTLFERLRVYPGQNMNDPSRAEELSKPLERWIADEMIDQHKSTYVMAQEVVGALQGAFTSGLLAGNTEAFRSQFQYAALFHRYYMEEQLRTNALAEQGRTENLPKDFRELTAQVYFALLQNLELDDSEQIYSRSPDDLKQAAYDLIRERFKPELDELAKTGGTPFDKSFPEPPGMEEYRALVDRWRMAFEKSRPPTAAPK